MAVPAGDHRGVHPGVPVGPLGARELRPLLREEDHQRVVEQFPLPQCPHYVAHLPVEQVDFGQIGRIALARLRRIDEMGRQDQFPEVEFRGVAARPRDVRVDRGHHQAEGFFPVARDELLDPLHRVRGVFRQAVDRESGYPFERKGLLRVDVPFPCQPHPVAEPRQAHGHGLDLFADRAEVVVPAVADRVHARVEAVARGHARRYGVPGVREAHACAGQRVDVRRAVVDRAVTPDVMPAAVVGQDDDHVGALLGRGLLPGQGGGREASEHQYVL